MSARRKSEKGSRLIRMVIVFLLVLIALSVLFVGYYVCTQYYDINIQITRKNCEPANSDPIEAIIGIKFNDTMQDAHEKLGYPDRSSYEDGKTTLKYSIPFKAQKDYMDFFSYMNLEFSADNRLVEITCNNSWLVSERGTEHASNRSKVIEAVNAFAMFDEQIRPFLGYGEYSINGKSYDSQEELYERLMDSDTDIKYYYLTKNDDGYSIHGWLTLEGSEEYTGYWLRLTFRLYFFQ